MTLMYCNAFMISDGICIRNVNASGTGGRSLTELFECILMVSDKCMRVLVMCGMTECKSKNKVNKV